MSATMTLLERVALAIQNDFDAQVRPNLPKTTPINFDSLARAAVEAMRRPNGWMILRGTAFGHDPARVWEAMIDAALGEKP